MCLFKLLFKMLFILVEFFGFFLLVLYVWMFCLHICLCTVCVPCAYGDQRRALAPLNLGLQMVVSYHLGAGT